jgi:peptidoglycan-associated lipoprotein
MFAYPPREVPEPTSSTASDSEPPHVEPEPRKVEVEVGLESEHIRTGSPIHWEDPDTLLPETYVTLDAVAVFLLAHPEIEHVIVEGHCDNRGTMAANRAASGRAAVTVVEYLSVKVPLLPMWAPGYGATAPVCPTLDDACRARNRRIEIRVKLK